MGLGEAEINMDELKADTNINIAENHGTQDARPTKLERAKAFAKRHGAEIVLGTGCVVLIVVCAKQGRLIDAQQFAMMVKDKIIAAKDVRIGDLEVLCGNLGTLCAEKNAYISKLASDALRHGSSEGGRALRNCGQVVLAAS